MIAVVIVKTVTFQRGTSLIPVTGPRIRSMLSSQRSDPRSWRPLRHVNISQSSRFTLASFPTINVVLSPSCANNNLASSMWKQFTPYDSNNGGCAHHSGDNTSAPQWTYRVLFLSPCLQNRLLYFPSCCYRCQIYPSDFIFDNFWDSYSAILSSSQSQQYRELPERALDSRFCFPTICVLTL